MDYYAASTDDPATNRKFAEELGVDFPILSDPAKATAKAYGVLMPIGLASRATVYVGKDGRILAVDRKIDVDKAGADIAKKLAELNIPKHP